MSESFPAPYTSTTLICAMASIECGLIAIIAKHDISAWSLRDPMRIIVALYAVWVTQPFKAFFFIFFSGESYFLSKPWKFSPIIRIELTRLRESS